MKKAAYFLLLLMVFSALFAMPARAAESWNGLNSLRLLKSYSIDSGVSASMIAMLLLLPAVATIVSFLHYYIGLSGYGIFMPTIIAVTFLSTGVLGGLVLFALILAISLVSNAILKKFKLHFWPARAINLVFIGIGVLALSLAIDAFRANIYAVMIMILLVEEFVRTQLIKSKSEARNLTIGTLLLACTGAGIMGIPGVQKLVLDYPDVTVLIVIVANIVIGNYRGMRLTEIGRFCKAIRK
jgi:signal transduction histidine kinase